MKILFLWTFRLWWSLIRSTKMSQPPLLISHRKREKKFSSRDKALAVFCYSVVIRTQLWLSVGIRETVPNNDSWRCSSWTADFSAIPRSRKVVLIPFERRDSNDYPNIKIFSIWCEIAMHGIKQGKTKFYRRY